MPKKDGNHVLEIDPGTGRLLRILSEDLNCETTAVELSEEMIKYAKLRLPNTKYILGNILDVRGVEIVSMWGTLKKTRNKGCFF